MKSEARLSSNVSAVPTGVLERSLLVLGCFNLDEPRLHLREIAVRTSLDKATVLRFLHTFVSNGYVQRLEDGRYAPGPAILRLASVYNTLFDVNARITVVLQRVAEQADESAAFYTLNGDERICVARANARRAVRYQVEVGHGVKLSSGGAAAHVLLAYTGGRSVRTEEVLRQGYVITAREREPDLASIALPVFDADSNFLGALVVSGPVARQTKATWARAREIAATELQAQGFLTSALRADATIGSALPKKTKRTADAGRAVGKRLTAKSKAGRSS